MNAPLPDPLVPEDCDCTNLPGFLLNVERLMASELVALSSHEVIAAALFLWCRAWKQKPAASLPDDDRVLASFARMPLVKFRKLREKILHGFVKCSDGRLYHRFLATEAMNAFDRKKAFQNKRERDAERLRNWRNETHDETRFETQDETHFVAEGQCKGQCKGQVRDREGTGKGQGPSEKTHTHIPARSARGPLANASPHECFEGNAGNDKAKGNGASKPNGGCMTAIPPDWQPSAASCQFSTKRPGADLNPLAHARVVESFKAHQESNAKMSADWDAEFRKYVVEHLNIVDGKRARGIFVDEQHNGKVKRAPRTTGQAP